MPIDTQRQYSGVEARTFQAGWFRTEIDLTGLDIDPADLAEALAVDVDAWKDEIPSINEWYEFVGDKLPADLQGELDALVERLDQA